MTHQDFRENIWMAFDTLVQHKLRSFLTILGVVIGTTTVIVIAAFVSGIDAQMAKEIESFGTNSIYIFKFDPGFNFNPSAEERTRKPLSYDDAMARIGKGSTCELLTVTSKLRWTCVSSGDPRVPSNPGEEIVTVIVAVPLVPGTGEILAVTMKRYANAPTALFPWER